MKREGLRNHIMVGFQDTRDIKRKPNPSERIKMRGGES